MKRLMKGTPFVSSKKNMGLQPSEAIDLADKQYCVSLNTEYTELN